MPFNVAAGNSSGYNYVSRRLDHQTYFKAIRVDQSHLECVVLDRVPAAQATRLANHTSILQSESPSFAFRTALSVRGTGSSRSLPG
jgi:hypothetical protein